tara:strand:- start:71 stop:268 length:198 start_codon:yes stop_codon:yes gene_type:complete
MIKNKNTTIDKIALSEFDTHYENLSDNLKQWCNLEMVTNSKWLDPFWKQEDYQSEVDKWFINKKI